MSYKHAILVTLFVSTGSIASTLTDTRPCRSLDNNSCWHTINQSQKAADLHCKLPYHADFSVNNIEPGGLLSKQFTRAWGDGLGFPEPGKPVLCTLFTEETSRQLGFSTFGWGGRVKIYITPDQELEVHQKDGWSDRTRVIRSDD